MQEERNWRQSLGRKGKKEQAVNVMCDAFTNGKYNVFVMWSWSVRAQLGTSSLKIQHTDHMVQI
jgi:hypothetical protein